MARRKTITKEQILNAAYEIIANEGFSKFTARNIAAKMKCSTQPIYLEFKNMNDLKEELFKKINKYLIKDVFSVVHTGDKVVDLSLSYIHFAKNESKFYHALYLEEYGEGKRMQVFSYTHFFDTLKTDSRYKNLTDEQINALYTGIWIVSTGLAALMGTDVIHTTEEQIKHLMKESIDAILGWEHPIEIITE
ncbi:transcriptional regulator, TetR family [Melissococcus plutonius]|uniref:Transcriptional regulator, TetR family n=1 Tax=Melissococcus plutonius (strain ATCC 35311 / DSM 29964 / CIP 104052 / LMG 20360 / NCIMB 702443) TaxID=940190 RepID=F3Y9T0_MELPT|nr:TetR/AcrR family transcriptional regulator [Melissococcus plutonius]AIM24790.1 transcriptional regulator, TetR family [Melissococcus plutonius S1]KMT24907.1 transcriptional regulator, TetR family [Melissococcus plutonius]KMT26544.1 transcriptional regulator, TetR family [Melissococcus plutonius]KMT27794.1 transcriptional regulator, TetR family [Melissococcus plutonius]KMT29566.1 transcriptional regulator, TetR family [Melissococcus plutonius]